MFIFKVALLLVEASLFHSLCFQFIFMLLGQLIDLSKDYFFEEKKYGDCI